MFSITTDVYYDLTTIQEDIYKNNTIKNHTFQDHNCINLK